MDPNKYKKNADLKPDTLVQTLLSVGQMILMLIGIIGIAMQMFKDGGWFKTGLSWLFESGSHMLFIPVIMLVLWLLNAWFSSPSKDESKKSGNFPMYVMVAIGAFFVYQFVTTGSF